MYLRVAARTLVRMSDQATTCPGWCTSPEHKGHTAEYEREFADAPWRRAHTGHQSERVPAFGAGVHVAWIGEQVSGIGYLFAVTVDADLGNRLSPDEARRLAQQLLTAADDVDGVSR